MPLAHNSERGEVPLAVGGVDLVVAAEMGRMATLSTRLQCQSFAELYLKLVQGELAAIMAGVEVLTIRGDFGKALKAMSLADVKPCREAFAQAMLFHSKDDEPSGNGEAASETSNSTGGNGNASPSET